MAGNEGVPAKVERARNTPRVKVLDDVDFEVKESDIDGYHVVILPEVLKQYFDEGYEAIRIRSTRVARMLPDYGGQTVSGYSLTPHQDHTPDDPRKFLALSLDTDTQRNATTYVTYPETIQKALPEIRAYFEEHRTALKEIYEHSKTAKVTEEEARDCFEIGGLDRLVQKKLGPHATDEQLLYAYSGLFTYLIQGLYADEYVSRFIEKYREEMITENWEEGGVLIFNNPKVFHGRLGGNKPPLKRNWFVSA